MRIAILTNAFPPDGHGGAERTAWTQAEGLVRLGHTVCVWAPAKSEAYRGNRPGVGKGIWQGIDVVRFSSLFSKMMRKDPLWKLWFHLREDGRAHPKLAEEIIQWKPDVLLTHNLVGCGWATPRQIQRAGVRWIHTLHDIQFTDPLAQESVGESHSVALQAWRWFWSWYHRRLFGVPDTLVSPTQWLLDWHAREGLYVPRTMVLPNPMEIGMPHERVLARPATIAYVGRLSREKGFDLFLHIATRLPPSLIRRIVVIGGGRMTTFAERISDERLLLRGAISFEDARRAIRDADLLFAPSQILENQQTILLEAMAEGTPAVATDVGGTRETLEGTGCPVLPPTDHTEAFEQAITHLLSDADEWRRISHAMQHRAERHRKEVYLEKLTKLFTS